MIDLRDWETKQIVKNPPSLRMSPHDPSLKETCMMVDLLPDGPSYITLIGIIPVHGLLGHVLPAVGSCCGQGDRAQDQPDDRRDEMLDEEDMDEDRTRGLIEGACKEPAAGGSAAGGAHGVDAAGHPSARSDHVPAVLPAQREPAPRAPTARRWPTGCSATPSEDFALPKMKMAGTMPGHFYLMG